MKFETVWNIVQGGLAAVGGFLGWYLGGFDGLIYALIALCAADYVTGVMCAFVRKELSSEIGARGISKKVYIFTLVGLGHILDVYLLSDGTALRTALIFWYIGNEGISLIENAVVLHVPVPDVLKNALVQIRNKGNKSKTADSEKDDDGKNGKGGE
jgi:toxin secretion/phage lysis holin